MNGFFDMSTLRQDAAQIRTVHSMVFWMMGPLWMVLPPNWWVPLRTPQQPRRDLCLRCIRHSLAQSRPMLNINRRHGYLDEQIIAAVEYGHTALLCSVVTSRLTWSHKNHSVAGGGEP